MGDPTIEGKDTHTACQREREAQRKIIAFFLVLHEAICSRQKVRHIAVAKEQQVELSKILSLLCLLIIERPCNTRCQILMESSPSFITEYLAASYLKWHLSIAGCATSQGA